MGRRKIQIKAIENQKSRIDTFHKRKIGLVKKAAELSMLCGIRMLLAFEDLSGGVFRYSTHGIFEPRDYFQEAWLKATSSKTKKDYPDFFVKIPKKRKRKSKAKADNSVESSKSSDSEIDIENERSNSSSIASEAEKMDESDNQSRGAPTSTDNILDALEGIDRHLSSCQFPANNGLPNDTQVFLQSIKKSIAEIKRRPHNTVQLETAPVIAIAQSDPKNRRRTVATSRASVDKRLIPVFGSGTNSSYAPIGRKGTFDSETNDPKRLLMLKGDFNDVIFEESESGKPLLNMSPINRDRGSVMDFMDDEYFKKARSTNDYHFAFSGHQFDMPSGHNPMGDYGDRNLDMLKNPYMANSDGSRVLFPFGNFSRVHANSNEIDKLNSPMMMHQENNSGALLNGTFKEGQSKSDSDHSKSRIENSKINTKDFWMNLSRLDGSGLENSGLLKEDQTFEPNSMLRFSNNRMTGFSNNNRSFGSEGDNSGLMLFSPIPLTSMTVGRRSESPDWYTHAMKHHNELQQKQQQYPTHEQAGNSFQSDSSIIKSPKLKKHVKDS